MRVEGMQASRILLYGPKGCGKTSFASACFNEAAAVYSGWVTTNIIASEILIDPITNIKSAFDAIQRYHVKGLFIEDVDHLYTNLRSNVAAHQMFIERIHDPSNVQLAIATTRYPETLTTRELEVFKEAFPILYPDEEERLDILRVHTRGIKLDGGVSLKEIASNTQWWSGEEIRDLIQHSKKVNNNLSNIALLEKIEDISQSVYSEKRVERMKALLRFTTNHCNNKKIRDDALKRHAAIIENEVDLPAIKASTNFLEGGRVPVHPNIRILVDRMNDALKREDYSGVLHSSASIFETLAKDIVGISNVQNQTLKSFFDRYRKDSALPEKVLDYILAIYESRNITPLAGHGSTQIPGISREVAIALSEMTVAFVRIEYILRDIRT
jgi:SpoVK/Ycf46/Vps4 family AAA+-type ATPase